VRIVEKKEELRSVASIDETALIAGKSG
jgi:hypothetical protein